ncbi:MAG: hypothetical protein EOP48_34060, partial [Sphingobacteriales bacterium]
MRFYALSQQLLLEVCWLYTQDEANGPTNTWSGRPKLTWPKEFSWPSNGPTWIISNHVDVVTSDSIDSRPNGKMEEIIE